MSEQVSQGIYPALAAIQRGIHAVGVGKIRKNVEQKFNFRGIDDALAAFAPLLTESGVVVIPSYSDITTTERPTRSGGITFNVRLTGTFRFVYTPDGSDVVVGPFYGEANDGQDKAISKATSIAYRNALFLTFSVPHEPAIGGDPDGQSEAESGYDIAAWADAIASAVDRTGLDKIAAELKAQPGIPENALRNIRFLWSKRIKEVCA